MFSIVNDNAIHCTHAAIFEWRALDVILECTGEISEKVTRSCDDQRSAGESATGDHIGNNTSVSPVGGGIRYIAVVSVLSLKLAMIAPIVAAAAVAALSIIAFNSKKSILHVLLELKYEMLFQIVGWQAIYDDFRQRKRNQLRKLPPRTGEVAVITGGARGIGVEVIKTLLGCEMKVVMGIRQPEAAKKIIETLKKEGISTDLDVYELDLASMKSVHRFANIVREKYPEISLLINNAGIMFGKYKLTEDGFESQLATNYLGHFYLTHMLLANLKRGGEKMDVCSRVVNVSSCAHLTGDIFFEDMQMKSNYISPAAYAQSKLAQVMFGKYLNAKLEGEGARVKSYSVHPGVVNTDLFVESPLGKYARGFMKLVFKTPEQGAVSIVYTCLSPKLETRGGLYVSNCRQGPSKEAARDVVTQKRLFDVTCELVKIKQFGDVES